MSKHCPRFWLGRPGRLNDPCFHQAMTSRFHDNGMKRSVQNGDQSVLKGEEAQNNCFLSDSQREYWLFSTRFMKITNKFTQILNFSLVYCSEMCKIWCKSLRKLYCIDTQYSCIVLHSFIVNFQAASVALIIENVHFIRVLVKCATGCNWIV